MMEVMDFRLRMKIKQERMLYSSPRRTIARIRYLSQELSDLIVLTHSQLAVFHSRSSQLARLGTIHVFLDSSKATLSRMIYLTLRHFMSLHENNPRNTCISQSPHISNQSNRINYVIL